MTQLPVVLVFKLFFKFKLYYRSASSLIKPYVIFFYKCN